ncbi:hypothetical protein [uncultured Deefgea sp.]|uniref:hypothetical protein n=1 Tax=uncultured Deefgea sp. TaxID=1304914 RepID=UPI00259912FF|nr:hypothetical protein [uncultured Deefgea sp.]
MSNHKPYKLPTALPCKAQPKALRFAHLIESIEGLQRGVAQMPDSGCKAQLVEHGVKMQAQSQQLIELFRAIEDQLSLCEDGLLALADLLETNDTKAMQCGRLLSLLTPLLQRQQDANNHLMAAL